MTKRTRKWWFHFSYFLLVLLLIGDCIFFPIVYLTSGTHQHYTIRLFRSPQTEKSYFVVHFALYIKESVWLSFDVFFSLILFYIDSSSLCFYFLAFFYLLHFLFVSTSFNYMFFSYFYHSQTQNCRNHWIVHIISAFKWVSSHWLSSGRMNSFQILFNVITFLTCFISCVIIVCRERCI